MRGLQEQTWYPDAWGPPWWRVFLQYPMPYTVSKMALQPLVSNNRVTAWPHSLAALVGLQCGLDGHEQAVKGVITNPAPYDGASRERKVSAPSLERSPSAAGRPQYAMMMASAVPRTSGPSPHVQSRSVGASRSPAIDAGLPNILPFGPTNTSSIQRALSRSSMGSTPSPRQTSWVCTTMSPNGASAPRPGGVQRDSAWVRNRRTNSFVGR